MSIIPGRAAFLTRGQPGLGRVSPSIALAREWRLHGRVDCRFVSYAAGVPYLRALNECVFEVSTPNGECLNPLDHAGKMAVRFLTQDFAPDVVVVDGEPLFVPVFTELGLPVVALVNPHDVFGKTNHFRFVQRTFLRTAQCVIACGLQPNNAIQEVVTDGITIHCTKPLVKPPRSPSLPTVRRGRNVLVTSGGGITNAGETYARLTREYLVTVVQCLVAVADTAHIDRIMVLPSAGVDMSPLGSHPKLVVCDDYQELVDLLPNVDLVFAKAGRNTTAELLAHGTPAIITALSEDVLRGGEQRSNAGYAERAPQIRVLPLAALTIENMRPLVLDLLALDATQRLRTESGNTQVVSVIGVALAEHQRSHVTVISPKIDEQTDGGGSTDTPSSCTMRLDPKETP